MKKDLSTIVSEAVLAELKESYPVEATNNRITLPRLSMVSQDQTEGTGKAMTVTVEAGTFLKEIGTEELNEEGKKIWKKDELGKSIEVTIIYKRKQLRMYDENTELYTSSPIFDNDDEIVPLFSDKKEVARGTPADLKAKYQYEKDGKTKSKLEENRVLYVLYKGEVYQMSLRGSSMWAFSSFERTCLVPSVLLKLGSEAKEKGQVSWNQMTFTIVRPLDEEEATKVLGLVKDIKLAIGMEKSQYKNTAEVVDPLKGF